MAGVLCSRRHSLDATLCWLVVIVWDANMSSFSPRDSLKCWTHSPVLCWTLPVGNNQIYHSVMSFPVVLPPLFSCESIEMFRIRFTLECMRILVFLNLQMRNDFFFFSLTSWSIFCGIFTKDDDVHMCVSALSTTTLYCFFVCLFFLHPLNNVLLICTKKKQQKPVFSIQYGKKKLNRQASF